MMMNSGFSDRIEIHYNSHHWKLLRRLREKSLEIMKALAFKGIYSGIHGSVVRGDVTLRSDIDIIIPSVISSYQVELALTLKGFKIYSRKIAQATPRHTPKAHIFLDIEEKECVTFPLASLGILELEFYKFGGFLELSALKEDKRLPGCNKELMLIEPTLKGHTEFSIRGREGEVARIVGVSSDIVRERVRVLMRRRKIGRTGIVLTVHLQEDEVFESVLERLKASNPIVRRRLRKG